MATSSPLTDPPPSSVIQNPSKNLSTFRRTKEIPPEVVQNIQSYYEEDLNAQGFDFCYALTANSASTAEVLIPPVSHLSLAATLCIHPNTTTRASDSAKSAQSVSAFRLLRLLQRISGHRIPWRQAFHFRKYDFFQAKIKEDIFTQFESLHKYNANSLFNRAEDFWAVVGWAFNCACLPDRYALRWNFFEPFLSLMLDILECDFGHHAEQDSLDDSLLWSFIEVAAGGSGRSRRIMRAIFADGTSRYLNEFREIFRSELKPPKKPEERPNADLNLDQEQLELAEYDATSDDASEDDTRPTKRVRTRTRTSARSSNESLREDYTAGESSTLGPPAALRLRARLMRLLAELVNYPSLTAHSPTTFVDRDELYTLFVEFIKPLPLPLFIEFVMPNTSTGRALDVLTHSRLCEAFLQRTLESRAPATPDREPVTAARLIECYLPYGASGSGMDAQARVSLLVEALTRRAFEGLRGKSGADVEVLRWATEEGIRKREDAARDSRKKSRKKEDDVAMKALEESGTRLRVILRSVG